MYLFYCVQSALAKKFSKYVWEEKQKFSISALNLQVALAVCFCNVDFKYMYK